MSLIRTVLVLAVLSAAAMAHPMGNFSVNHYSRLHFQQSGLDLTYVLDLAEIPTFQLLGASTPDPQALEARMRAQAKEWVANLILTGNGRHIEWQVTSIASKTTDGAGGMPILRVTIEATAPLQAGTVTYDDRNFAGRAGWKEIVINHAPDAVLTHPSQTAKDLSAALTVYPSDPSITPPQAVHATADWAPAAAVTAIARPVPAAEPERPANTFAAQQPTAPGSVVRGDFLSRMLQKKTLGWRLLLLCVAAAFGLGSMHALSPGHGKTIVAAYLVGSRGTFKHAGLLGLVVTFTHTFSVFLLGLGVLFFQQYVVPEKILPVLGAISGLSIVAVGLSLLYRRAQALLATAEPHEHRVAPSLRGQDHDHEHEHGAFTHTHGGSTHSHAIEGDISAGSLIALGVGGGLVPCPSALILMLSAIALGRPGFGLVLLAGFSAGLSLVLMSIGALALYARHLLPDGRKASQHPAFRLIPVFSSVVVIVLGLAITAVSAGWLQPMRFLA